MDIISCCCESFLSVVSKGTDSWITLAWKGSGMCTGATCEEGLGGCCSLDVDLLSGMWSPCQESFGETGEGRGHVACGSETDSVLSAPVGGEVGSKEGLVKSGGSDADGIPRGEEGGFEVAFFRDITAKEVMLIESDAGMERVEGDIGGRDPLVSSILELCLFRYRMRFCCQCEEGRKISGVRNVWKRKEKKKRHLVDTNDKDMKKKTCYLLRAQSE